MGAGKCLTNGSQIKPRGDCRRESWELGDRVEGNRFFAGAVKFPLKIELNHFDIALGHADVAVSHHLHQGRQADAEAHHLGGEGVP